MGEEGLEQHMYYSSASYEQHNTLILTNFMYVLSLTKGIKRRTP